MSTWRLGDIAVDRVVEVEGPALSPDVLYPDAAPEVIEAHRHWLEPGLLDPASGLLIISFHSFVIRTAHHVIVVDTCGGNDKSRPGKVRYHMNSHPYLDNLATAGIAPEDVDFVLCTHLHVDHVGWNTRLLDWRWVPTFPNAKYLFGRVEWEFWERQYQSPAFTDDPYYEDSILPVIEAGQAEFVAQEIRQQQARADFARHRLAIDGERYLPRRIAARFGHQRAHAARHDARLSRARPLARARVRRVRVSTRWRR